MRAIWVGVVLLCEAAAPNSLYIVAMSSLARAHTRAPSSHSPWGPVLPSDCRRCLSLLDSLCVCVFGLGVVLREYAEVRGVKTASAEKHRLNRAGVTPANTAEYGGVRRSECPLER